MGRIALVLFLVALLLAALVVARQGAGILYEIRMHQVQERERPLSAGTDAQHIPPLQRFNSPPGSADQEENTATPDAQVLFRITDELANRQQDASLSAATSSSAPELSYAKGSPEQRILEKLKRIVDPELGVNVVDLGLIKGISVSKTQIILNIILTTPKCPYMDGLIAKIKRQAGATLPGCRVKVVVDLNTRWSPADLTAEGNRILLGGG